MSKRVTDEKKLKANFQKRQDEKKKEEEMTEHYFDKLDDIKGEEDQKIAETNEQALKTYKDLFVDEEMVLNVKGVTFKFRKNPTILEYEEMQSVKEDDPKRKEKLLLYSYNLMTDPEMPFEDYARLPPYIIKYIEQKISEHFLMGLVSIVLED